MPHFPMFVDLSGRPVLIVGGGSVALRKLRKLAPYGPKCVVVAPEVAVEDSPPSRAEVAVADSEPSRSPRMEAPTGSRTAASTQRKVVTERPERSA